MALVAGDGKQGQLGPDVRSLLPQKGHGGLRPAAHPNQEFDLVVVQRSLPLEVPGEGFGQVFVERAGLLRDAC